MGLFQKIKKLFNKEIILSKECTCDLIVPINTAKGVIKTGTAIKVDEGFKLVILRYNKLFDVLDPGEYSIDEKVAPKLYITYFRERTGKGELDAKKITADMYYLSTKQIVLQKFKTFDPIFALADERKVKLRLAGTFNYQVDNIEKFMEYFADEFAVLTNDKVQEEISYLLSYNISKFLRKRPFNFKDYIVSKEKIEEFILNDTLMLNEIGLKVTKFIIEDVITSKKDLGLKLIIEHGLEENEKVSEEAEKLVNNKEQEPSYVYANNIQEKEESSNDRSLDENENIINVPPLNVSNTFTCSNLSSSETLGNGEARENESQPAPVIIDSSVEEYANKDKVTKEKNKSKTKKEENLSENNGFDKIKKVITKEKESKLVTCSCCGAKNFEDAEICCVCKSKLK